MSKGLIFTSFIILFLVSGTIILGGPGWFPGCRLCNGGDCLAMPLFTIIPGEEHGDAL